MIDLQGEFPHLARASEGGASDQFSFSHRVCECVRARVDVRAPTLQVDSFCELPDLVEDWVVGVGDIDDDGRHPLRLSIHHANPPEKELVELFHDSVVGGNCNTSLRQSQTGKMSGERPWRLGYGTVTIERMFAAFVGSVRARFDEHLLTKYRRLLPEEYTESGAGPGDRLYEIRNQLVFSHMQALVSIRMRGKEHLENVQNVRLRKLLRHAMRAPWWKAYFKGLDLSLITGVCDLANLPTVKRSQIAPVPIEQMVTRPLAGKDITRSYTSGSTDGVPFVVAHERTPIDGASYLGVLLKEHGFQLERVASKYFIIAVNLFGNKIADIPWSRSMVSCPIDWHSPEKVEEGLSRLLEADHSMESWVLFTHVTELFLIIDLLRTRKIFLKNLSATLLVGHHIESESRARAEVALKCPVISVYGTREFGLVLAGSCRNNRDAMHIAGEHVYFEILNQRGIPVPVGEAGQVHLTGLNNTLMPLIRYDIGDTGKIIDASCGCPNPNKLLQIENKTTDMLHFAGGSVVARRIFRIFLEESLATRVLAYQIVQESQTSMRVRVVLQKDAIHETSLVFERIKKEINAQRILPEQIEIYIEHAHALPTTNGKHKPFISLAAFQASKKNVS